MSKFQQLSEGQERSLVEKVDLRLVLAKDDAKFEQTLNTFLPPLLLKLASPYSSVRELVYESIKHITSRVNSHFRCKLPVRQLLQQVKKPNLNEGQDATNVIVYSSFFLSKGVERISRQESRELLPDIIEDISNLSSPAQTRIFHILCKVLLTWKAPLQGSSEERETIDFLNVNDSDLRFLVEKFLKFFLLVPKRTEGSSVSYSCPGLSSTDVSFFIYSPAIYFTKDLLNQYRRAIFDFTVSGLTSNDQILIPFLLVVSAQPIDISDSASTLLKRIKIPYDDETFVKYLSDLFCGNIAEHLPPVNPQIQEKILGLLTRSILITRLPNLPLRISMDGIASRNLRVKLAALVFIRHVAKNNHLALRETTGNDMTSIITAIKNDIQLAGWPRYNSQEENKLSGITLRTSQYETLGQLLRQDFDSVKNFEMVKFLLESLNGDLNEFRITIKDALGSLVHHFPLLPSESKKQLKQFLSSTLKDNYALLHGTSDEKEAIMTLRFVGMKFNNAAFPFEDNEARVFSILGTSRLNRFDVVQEAFKGLSPYQFRMNRASLETGFVSTDTLLAKKISETRFVDFSSFISLFLSEAQNKSEHCSIKDCIVTGVRFLRHTLISNSIYGKRTVVLQDENWSMRIEKSLEVDENVRKHVHENIEHLSESTVSSVLLFLFNEIIHENNVSSKDDPVFSKLFLVLVTYAKNDVIMKSENILASTLKRINTKQSPPDIYTDSLVNSFGIIGARIGLSSHSVSQILATDFDQESNNPSAIIPVLVYLLASLIPRLQLLHSVEFGTVVSRILQKITKQYLSGSCRELSLKAYCELLKYRTLDSLDAVNRKSITISIKDAIKDKLFNDELAIMTWGYLYMNSNETEFDDYLGVYETIHSSKHIDYLFVSGESLTIILGGWNSKLLERQLDINYDVKHLQELTTTTKLQDGLNRVLSFCSSTKPSLQKASCIWLLCIVQYLGHLRDVSAKFNEIHAAFTKFLAHREEFVQESASRGLSIVYDMSDADMRETMVKGLFKTLTNSSSALSLQAGSVSGETELFDAGVLSTNDGSVSTYKDILNLANEVNDPGLVYKFMALAKNSSLWNSRKGVAFGIGAIFSNVSLQDQLINDSTLSKRLVPKLFRYRFDPSTDVANSMDNIWDTLFPEGSQAVEKYFDIVLEEVLTNSGNREWRVREASSAALLHLVQTYPLENFENKFEEIWTVAFRLLDDIKDSVRKSGTSLARTLSKILIRSINGHKNTARMQQSKVLDIILPFLLGTKGLNSDAEEVRIFALNMLLDLIKESKESLKYYVPTLVYELTMLLSVLEPQVINYLTLNADKFNVKASAIDEHRLQGVTNSPIMQAIEALIDISDSNDEKIQKLVDSCILASRKSVGLPSNIGASRVLQLLCIRHSIILKPYCGKLLKACSNGMNNKNVVVASSYASSFGRLFKVSTLDKQIKYSEKVVQKFFETEDFEKQKVTGVAIESILKYSAEDFDNVANILMPLVYIAKHSLNGSIADQFDGIWIESSKSGSSSLDICFSEIVDLVSIHIKSNIFSIRQTCTSALCKACQNYNGPLKPDIVNNIFEVLLEACQGRSWDGKASVVSGVLESFKKLSARVTLDKFCQRIDTMIIAELSRRNKSYVKGLIQPFAEYVFFRNDQKLYEKLIDVTQEVFLDLELEDNNETHESNDNMKSKKPRLLNDLNRASSKKNIEMENYRIEIIKTVAKGYKDILHEEKGINTNNVIKLVFEFMKGMFESSKILYSWRSELAYFDVAILLITPWTKTEVSSNDVSHIFIDIWKYGHALCNKKEVIESVKIKLIRYGGLLKEKFPHTNTMVDFGILEILRVDDSSVLKAEALNIGISQ